MTDFNTASDFQFDFIVGSVIGNLGHSIKGLGGNDVGFLGNRNNAGFLFIRQTHQCLVNLNIPEAPYLFGVLMTRWEVPWAKLFPLRLMLRLGAEYRCKHSQNADSP